MSENQYDFEQAKIDIRHLIGIIDYLIEATGEGLPMSESQMVADIRASIGDVPATAHDSKSIEAKD